MAASRICLVFSDTGGGHRSAAEAIEAAIREIAPAEGAGPVEVLQENVAERSHPINRWFVEFYNYLLRHNQASMKHYTWFIETFKPNDSALGYLLCRKYTTEMLEAVQPSVVVSVHPMVNHYMTQAMRDLGMAGRVKFITVITDPNSHLWSGWACRAADLIIAPNDLSRDRLLKLGIDPERIRVLGMPINPQFLRPPLVTRKDFLRALGLDPDRLTVCITAGWAGGGNMFEIYKALARVRRGIQIVFVCGHNSHLFEQVRKEASASSVPTAVLPFHDSMSDLMSAVDLLVTKAGGLTTFEAVARRLPMAIDVLTEPMPQEAGTVELLARQGLASPLHRPADIIPLVENLPRLADRYAVPLPAAHSLDRVDAVFDIARTILAACDPAVADQEAASRVARPARPSWLSPEGDPCGGGGVQS